MASGADIVRRALKKLGVLASGETPNSEELADGIADLNALLDSWANERLAIFGTRRAEYLLTANLSPHTLGEGGTFPYTFPFGLGGGGAIDAPRPVRLTGVGVIRVGQTVETPLKLLTDREYQLIPEKTLTDEVPRRVWMETTYPLANLWFWPVPTTAATVALYTWSRISQLSTNTQVSLPTGYEDALIYALAKKMAPDYGVALDPTFIDNHDDAVGAIRRANSPDLVSELDPALPRRGGAFNIYTDNY